MQRLLVGVRWLLRKRLLYWADEAVLRSFLSDDAFYRYLEKRRNDSSAAA